jgi:hypothetical protein
VSLLAVARVFAVVPQAFLVLCMPVNLLVPELASILRWAMCAVVAGCVVGLVWVLTRHPNPGLRKDGDRGVGYTVLMGSLGLLWPAYTTGIWPLLILPVIPPILVALETVENREPEHRQDVTPRRRRNPNLRRKRKRRRARSGR